MAIAILDKNKLFVEQIPKSVFGVGTFGDINGKLSLVYLLRGANNCYKLEFRELVSKSSRTKVIGLMCKECNSILLENRNFVNHMRLDQTDIMVCKICSAAFKDKYYYNHHSCPQLTCPFKPCTHKKKIESDMKKHMAEFHKHQKL